MKLPRISVAHLETQPAKPPQLVHSFRIEIENAGSAGWLVLPYLLDEPLQESFVPRYVLIKEMEGAGKRLRFAVLLGDRVSAICFYVREKGRVKIDRFAIESTDAVEQFGYAWASDLRFDDGKIDAWFRRKLVDERPQGNLVAIESPYSVTGIDKITVREERRVTFKEIIPERLTLPKWKERSR